MALISYMSRVQFDFGAMRLLPEELTLLGVKRPLLVTDPGVRSAGLVERVLAALDGSPPPVFEDTPSNPTEAAAEAALALHRAHGCDGVIALGGGRSISPRRWRCSRRIRARSAITGCAAAAPQGSARSRRCWRSRPPPARARRSAVPPRSP